MSTSAILVLPAVAEVGAAAVVGVAALAGALVGCGALVGAVVGAGALVGCVATGVAPPHAINMINAAASSMVMARLRLKWYI
jgi:hypothetical protein